MAFTNRSQERIARTVRRDEQTPTLFARERSPRPRPAGAQTKIVVIQASVGPGKAGTGRVYKVTNEDPESGDTVTIAAVSPTQDIVVLNFRPNWLASGIAYLAHKLGKHWVIENDACFQDFM